MKPRVEVDASERRRKVAVSLDLMETRVEEGF